MFSKTIVAVLVSAAFVAVVFASSSSSSGSDERPRLNASQQVQESFRHSFDKAADAVDSCLDKNMVYLQQSADALNVVQSCVNIALPGLSDLRIRLEAQAEAASSTLTTNAVKKLFKAQRKATAKQIRSCAKQSEVAKELTNAFDQRIAERVAKCISKKLD